VTHRQRWLPLVISLALIAAVTLVPRTEYAPPRFDWHIGTDRSEIIESLLNVALFAPLGAALRWIHVRLGGAVAAGLTLSLAVELMQRFLLPGREGELQDLISNTLGAASGWLLGTSAIKSDA
jgi:glycopeptide antibiotics resistance protein